ncbi:MAG: cytochrome c biogenesis protein CcsA [Bilophila wadsworthia]
MYVQLLAWCITLSGLVAWLRWRYEALLLTVAPFSLLTFLIALLLRHAETPLPRTFGMTFTIHIAAIFISIGLMALALARACFSSSKQRASSRNQSWRASKGISCPLRIGQDQCVHDDGRLSAVHGGRAFGFISARINWGTILSGDPKEFISLVVWGLYAWLFHQRFTQGWQGRKPAILAIWIFTVCAFSLIVVNLFMTTHHSFLTTPR